MTEIYISQDSADDYWKWILVAVCVTAGLVVLGYVIYRYVQAKRVSPELTDADIERPFEHEVIQQKKQAKKDKINEEERKKEAAAAEKRRVSRDPDQDKLMSKKSSRARSGSRPRNGERENGNVTVPVLAVKPTNNHNSMDKNDDMNNNDNDNNSIHSIRSKHNNNNNNDNGINSVSSKRGLHSVYDELKSRKSGVTAEDTRTLNSETPGNPDVIHVNPIYNQSSLHHDTMNTDDNDNDHENNVHGHNSNNNKIDSDNRTSHKPSPQPEFVIEMSDLQQQQQ